MIFFKRTLPLIITFCMGIITILCFFAGPGLPLLKKLDREMPEWMRIMFVFAMVLGGVSLLRLNIMKIQRKVEGWGYNLVLVLGFVTMATLGMLEGFEGSPARLQQGASLYMYKDQTREWLPVTVQGTLIATGTVHIEDKIPEGANFKSATLLEKEKIAPGTDLASGTEWVRYYEYVSLVLVKDAAGNDYKVKTNKVKGWFMSTVAAMQQFLFHGVFKAAQATMFSLLAFFVASASFRAFRVKSKEAALLMGAAFIVMLGNVPIGNLLTALLAKVFLGFLDFPAMKEWIMTYPSSAAQSAIVIGASLGYISASLKILLGVERSYLGGES